MPFMTFEDQITSHISFLRTLGLDVADLKTTGEFVRCHEIGSSKTTRGDFAYKTHVNEMRDRKWEW